MDGVGGTADRIGDGGVWGRVAFAELEAERQSVDAFEMEADRAKAGGLVSGTRAVTWNMQVSARCVSRCVVLARRRDMCCDKGRRRLRLVARGV